jgi:hypothetical protein
LQRAQLLNNKESQDHSRSSGDEEVLQALPEAYAAQGSKVVSSFRFQVSRGRFIARNWKLET